MDEPLPNGGMIRKLWVGETDAYRDHLLRLDRESRHRRFSGAVSDEFIAQHAASAGKLGVVVHGFFVDGVLRGYGSVEGGIFAPGSCYVVEIALPGTLSGNASTSG